MIRIKQKKPTGFFAVAGIALGTAAILYYLAAGFAAGFSVSVLWVWLVAGCVLVLLGIADLCTRRGPRWLRAILLTLRGIILVCAVWFFALQICVLSGMMSDCTEDVDYLLIAGAMVYGEEPSPALLSRLDAAYAYLAAHPGAKAILCGGQGAGEDITEAECMRRVLTEYGIDESRLIREESSTTTAENMQNAFALIGDADASAAVVTNNFHVFRTARIAKKSGWQRVYGIAAPFSGILLPHYMAREFLTISVDTLRGNM